MSILKLSNVSYKYDSTNKTILKGVTAEFDSGKLYTIMGKSGSGKTTLLSLISGLDICTEGTVDYNGNLLSKIDRDKYRAESVGVIFQSYNLLTNATAIENIVLSMNISEVKEKNKKKIAYELLEKVGVDRETADRKILKLSGGEQQRIGIARALAHNPDIIIADEPTGNLDGDTEKNIMGILKALAHDENKCVIVVTHSKKVSTYADELLTLNCGNLSF
jgi:putative ABC transport system ATP-binding protein